ncbi:uncharacterized protein [Oscarella lobularis]|uniref:uncharacterized protein n=1 Tax=Oscarella lobularis TaxID=121494 RepID=UPI003313521A
MASLMFFSVRRLAPSFVQRRGAVDVARRTYGRMLLGCGSNVVDQFFRVRALPTPGEKGFFADPNRILEDSVVGGVTLNHLAWAALLGVPSGLLGLQGDDTSGRLIRSVLERDLNIKTEFIRVSDKYTTAESYVFVQEDGERSIIMARGATSLMDADAVQAHFGDSVAKYGDFVSTEISQVPHAGVLKLLQMARKNAVTILDLDVSPSVAINEAGLGSLDDLVQCTKTAQILKPARHAAEELLLHLKPDIGGAEIITRMPAVDIVTHLRDFCGSSLVAMTSGSEGCALATKSQVIQVPVTPLDKVVDATGAGDAFLGGLIAYLYKHGMPQTKESLLAMGQFANEVGSACCRILGAVPNDEARETLKEQIAIYNPSAAGGKGSSAGGSECEEFYSSLTNDSTAAATLANNGIQVKDAAAFTQAILNCKGTILTSGIGKSGLIAQRMAASLASTGIRSHYVHAAEWAHGDYGKAERGTDLIIFISHSGKTEECVQAATHLKREGIDVLAITGRKGSPLDLMSTVSIVYPLSVREPLDILPTSSLLLQEMIANAVLRELIHRRRFSRADFLRNHPGGAVGDTLRKTE